MQSKEVEGIKGKLLFRYGAMGASKTANLLMVCYNYESTGRKIILLKPSIDNRYGSNIVGSRAGLTRKADFCIANNISISNLLLPVLTSSSINAIIVDEVNFFTREHINELRELTRFCPVICYGLRTDYKSNLFKGSKRLMEIADSIEEIKTLCVQCTTKATMNAKYYIKDGKKILLKEGSSAPDIGAEDKYQSMCWNCYSSS